MSYYRICPNCGAHLDPCERCDCKEKAASEAGTFESSKGQKSTNTVSHPGRTQNGSRSW